MVQEHELCRTRVDKSMTISGQEESKAMRCAQRNLKLCIHSTHKLT